MIYRLRTPYALRGWIGLPYTLARIKTNKVVKELSQKEFSILLLCDGEFDIDPSFLEEDEKTFIQQMMDDQFIEIFETVMPLDIPQQYIAYENRCMESIHWSLTGRCNYKCRHCFMDAPDGLLGEISTREALQIVDQIAECGIKVVDITGGEPLIRKDFWIILDALLEKGIQLGVLYTNGALFTEAFASGLVERGLRPQISISFDGCGWHDWMRRHKGAEEAALKALSVAEKYGMSTDVEMCLHKGNKNTIRETVNYLASFGVKAIKIGNVSQTELWKKNAEGLNMSDSEYLEAVLEYIPYYYEDNMPMQVMLNSVAVLTDELDKIHIVAHPYNDSGKCLNSYLCGCARLHGYVTPEGRLAPCLPLSAWEDQSIFLKLSEHSLKEQLSGGSYINYTNQKVKDLFEQNSECGSCEYRYQCGGGCRANALLAEPHDLMGSDRFRCFLWKNGYVDRIRAVLEKAISDFQSHHFDEIESI